MLKSGLYFILALYNPDSFPMSHLAFIFYFFILYIYLPSYQATDRALGLVIELRFLNPATQVRSSVQGESLQYTHPYLPSYRREM